MAVTVPTVIIDGSGGVSIDVVGMTYEEFLNSLGNNVYKVLEIYMTASSMQQFFQQIKYHISDATGLQYDKLLNYAVDPYQKVPAYKIDLRDDNIILNGQSNIDFNILPGESLMLQMLCETKSVTDKLDEINPNVVNNMDKDQDVLVIVENPADPRSLPVKYTVTDTDKLLNRPVEVRKPTLNLPAQLKKKISTSIIKKQNKTL